MSPSSTSTRKRLPPANFDAAALKVAIVHYWIVGDAGGEKVVKEIYKLFPQADIYVVVHDPAVSARIFPGATIRASFLQKLPRSWKYYSALLPLMPWAVEALNVSEYDLVISSESGPAKGVLPGLDAIHVCYCHTPMRYLWDQFHEYRETGGLLTRTMMSVFGPPLRAWDRMTADRVDAFAANSRHVEKRIRKYYGRAARVIAPPVDLETFRPLDRRGDFYLIGGRHVRYKRLDLAVEMANRTGRRLVITGEGPETAALKRLAGPTVEFRGRCPVEELQTLYAECRAFLMPGEEDFGITPVEAMASGRPVIALARGGALDTVIDGKTGVLFPDQSAEGLIRAVDEFERQEAMFDVAVIRAWAERFSTERFGSEFLSFVEDQMQAGSLPVDPAASTDLTR
ncbi:MAG: glycosyltransferase [Alphaproteobacteria bacterium]|nr:glycosyltransferase [Alphaproteobacteria bacterium]MBU2270029.1 glycosyltransferase [Alphaproteobacteria bacterium]MBU2417872.1 glycosyltransferase [Alphaproteobacteria bacterium]